MNMFINSPHKSIPLIAGALAFVSASTLHAAGAGQLGILNTSGTNPATTSEWAVDDTYHLIFVTTGTTDASSTDIASYNSFVQTQASNAGYGSVNWFALGSTATTDAIDNTNITAPVINAFDSNAIATDSADMWDFNFTNDILDLSGNPANVWTGTDTGGVGDADDQLGAATVRRHWSAWDSWGPAFNDDTNTATYQMIAISEQLTVVPEASTGLLIGLAALALVRRRR